MIKTKYCIIGSGAGGSIAAYELTRAGEEVIVLNCGKIPAKELFKNELSPQQRGDFGIQPDTKFPSDSEDIIKHSLYAKDEEKGITKQKEGHFQCAQIHQVNGLQNLWNGISLRNSKEDFDDHLNPERECSWPISYQDLAGHYSAVEKIISVTGNRDQITQFPDGQFVRPKSMRAIDTVFKEKNQHLESEDFRFFANRKAIDVDPDSPKSCTSCGSCINGCNRGSVFKFSTSLYPEIQRLPNFRLFEQIRVTSIRRISDERLLIYGIHEESRDHMEFEANILIIAAGAIESPRLLLNSFPQDHPGMKEVGRYLQDSPYLKVIGSLTKAWFKPVPRDKGYGDHLLIGGRLTVGDEKSPFVGHLWSDFIKNPGYLSRIQFLPRSIRRVIAKQIYHSTVGLILWGPSVPKKENRLELSDEVDDFGQRLFSVHYERDPKEVETLRALEDLGRRLLKNAGGFGVSTIHEPPGMGIHCAATCRMGANQDQGVVDSELKVFGIPNVYVCDSSVIPRLSEKHPTLTIMALSHRLAKHLLGKYSSK